MKNLGMTALAKATMLACALVPSNPTITLASSDPRGINSEAPKNSFGIRYSYSSLGITWRHEFTTLNHFEAFIQPISTDPVKEFNFYGGRYIHNFPQSEFPFTPYVFLGVGMSTYQNNMPNPLLKENNKLNKCFGYALGQGVETKISDHLSLLGDVAITRLNDEPDQMLGIIRMGVGMHYTLK
ncbi:outer membrane protein [Aquirufa aurantiipilula]